MRRALGLLLAWAGLAAAQPVTGGPSNCNGLLLYNAGVYVGCLKRMDLTGGNFAVTMSSNTALIALDPAVTKRGALIGENADFAGTIDLTGKVVQNLVGHAGAKALAGGQCSATDCTTGLGTATTAVYWPLSGYGRGTVATTTGAVEALWPTAGKIWAMTVCANSAIDASTSRTIDVYDVGAAAVISGATCTIAASTQCCTMTSAGGIAVGAGKRLVMRGTGTGTLTARGIGHQVYATIDALN